MKKIQQNQISFGSRQMVKKYPLPKKSVKNMLKTMLNRQILDILREHKTI